MPPLSVQLLKARDDEKRELETMWRRNKKKKKKSTTTTISSAFDDEDDDDDDGWRPWRLPGSFSHRLHSKTNTTTTTSNASSLLSSASDTARSSFSAATTPASDRDSPPISAVPHSPYTPSPSPPPRSEWKLQTAPEISVAPPPRRRMGTVRDTLLAAGSSESDTDLDLASADQPSVAVAREERESNYTRRSVQDFGPDASGVGRRSTISSDIRAAAELSPMSPLTPPSLYYASGSRFPDGSDRECERMKIVGSGRRDGIGAAGRLRSSVVRCSLQAAFASASSTYPPFIRHSAHVDYDGISVAATSDTSNSPDIADKDEWRSARSRRKSGDALFGGLVLFSDQNATPPGQCRTPAQVGLLRCISDGFQSWYALRLPDSGEMMLARLSESGTGGRWLYKFFTRKNTGSNKGGSRRMLMAANGWMRKPPQDVGYDSSSSSPGVMAGELQIAAKMETSTRLLRRSRNGDADETYMVSEFVVTEEAPDARAAANMAARTYSSRLASTLTAALLRTNQSATCGISAEAAGRSFGRTHPEVAAVVIETGMEGIGEDEQQVKFGKLTMVVPAGRHSVPEGSRGRPSGPWTLMERWRCGGKCDCGGWDEGCGINVFEGGGKSGGGAGSSGKRTEVLSLTQPDHHREGSSFNLRFHPHRLRPLTAFAAAVAVLHNGELLAAPPVPPGNRSIKLGCVEQNWNRSGKGSDTGRSGPVQF